MKNKTHKFLLFLTFFFFKFWLLFADISCEDPDGTSLMCLQTYDAGLLPLPPLSSRGASHLLCGLLSWHSVRPLDIRRALHWPVALKDAALASGRCREEGTGEDVLRWRESRHICLGVHDTLRHVLAVLGVFVRLCGDECVSSSSSLFQGRAELLLTLSFGLVRWSD